MAPKKTRVGKGMWHLLYQITLALAAVFAAPFVFLRRRRHYTSSLLTRLGVARAVLPTNGERPIWIHAVSVGEVGVAATLLRHIAISSPLLVTTVTPTGQQRAKEEFPRSVVTYLPFDFGFAVRSFFDRFQPRLLVLTEGDYWPTVLRHAEKRRVPVIVINGRMSDRSFRRLRPVKRLLGPIFGPVDRFGVQTDLDRRRLIELEVPPDKVTVTGNLKFESPEPPLAPDLAALFRRISGSRPILVAGSTMRGEEEVVLEAFSALRADHEALLVLAPRHPERWDAVAEILDRSRLPWRRRSGTSHEVESTAPEVVLLDSLGELAGLYRLAGAAFIGGTLVPTGGHNPLEAARFGIPVAVGPSMENFLEIAAAFDSAAAWQRVSGRDDLARAWSRWLDRPEEALALGRRGADLVDRHRGAARQTLEILEPWLRSLEDGA